MDPMRCGKECLFVRVRRVSAGRTHGWQVPPESDEDRATNRFGVCTMADTDGNGVCAESETLEHHGVPA